MGEATGTAVKRDEEPATPAESLSAFDQLEDTLEAIARRAYDLFESSGREFGRDPENWFQAERELLHPMHVNITETDGSLEVRAEVPGFTEKEIEIGVEPHRLTIAGKRETKKEEKKGKTVYAESCSNQILRSVILPVKVETEKVTANLKNGVLEITLPKAGKAGTLRIHPKAA